MEAQHSDALEVVERLQARLALVVRLAGRRAELADLPGRRATAARARDEGSQQAPGVTHGVCKGCNTELQQLCASCGGQPVACPGGRQNLLEHCARIAGLIERLANALLNHLSRRTARIRRGDTDVQTLWPEAHEAHYSQIDDTE